MSAYLVTFVTAQNLDWVAEYLANVPAIVRCHGGTFLAVSKGVPHAIEVVEGTARAPQSIAIITFGTMDAVKGFLHAPEYAPYKNARNAATKSEFFAFENDDDAPQFHEPLRT